MRRAMSDNVLRFSTTASCGSIVMPNWFSKNVTALSTAMESRMPVVTSAVVSVNAAGSSRQELVKDKRLDSSFDGLFVSHRDVAHCRTIETLLSPHFLLCLLPVWWAPRYL